MTQFKKSISTVILIALFNLVGWSQNIKYNINPDGTFDIIGKTVKLYNCYPAINNQLVKVTGIKITDSNNQKTIQYNTIKGIIEITLAYQNNAITINTNLLSDKLTAESISPIQNAIVEGANRIYRTPECIGGDGGIKNWPKNNDDYNRCAIITGLVPDSGSTLIISSRNLSKFISYTYLYPYDNKRTEKLLNVYFSTELVFSKSLPTIYITENASAFDGMKNEAQHIANIAKVQNNKAQSYHWCSWYYAYYHLTEGMVSEYLQGFNSVSPKIPIQTFQIDAGFFPHVGDWLEPSHKFPQGIEKSVKEIISNGYKAGIWIGPYMVGNKSKIYTQHPDWILRHTDGSPIIEMKFYGEERLWGLFDEEVYILDISNPEAMEYLRQVFRAYRKMGITFYKTDFMLYGNTTSHTVKRHTPGKTAIEYQHDLFNMIRQEIGPESFWLGCIAPYAPMIGYVDAMRIGGDVSPEWKGFNNMFRESIGSMHFNNIWWQNDPDAIILRQKFSHLTDAEAKSMILWMGMLGGVINTSDLFHDIPLNRLNLFRFLEPSATKLTTSVPFINNFKKHEVMVRKYEHTNAYAALFVNKTDETKTDSYKIIELTGSLNKATCFNWEINDAAQIGNIENIEITLKPHECKLMYISENGNGPGNMTLGGK